MPARPAQEKNKWCMRDDRLHRHLLLWHLLASACSTTRAYQSEGVKVGSKKMSRPSEGSALFSTHTMPITLFDTASSTGCNSTADRPLPNNSTTQAEHDGGTALGGY